MKDSGRVVPHTLPPCVPTATYRVENQSTSVLSLPTIRFRPETRKRTRDYFSHRITNVTDGSRYRHGRGVTGWCLYDRSSRVPRGTHDKDVPIVYIAVDFRCRTVQRSWSERMETRNQWFPIKRLPTERRLRPVQKVADVSWCSTLNLGLLW